MAESTRVWVRTTALDKAVYGKSRSVAKRSIPGALGEASDDASAAGGGVNWGWARGNLVETKDDSNVQVFIQDEESNHDRNTVTLPPDVTKTGDLVMANIYEGDDEDGGDDGYDDYGGSGGGDGAGFPDDLITLTHLHEPAVVYCLRKRYSYDKIYTSTGPILLALNPFKMCKNLYSDAVMKQYWLRGEMGVGGGGGDEEKKDEGMMVEEEALPPHVYKTADYSFRTMMTRLEEGPGGGGAPRGRGAAAASKGCDQSILVSGESGAGKTVTTKFIMQYLATLSQRTHVETKKKETGSTKGNIEKQVLQSNPILESFGNARTIRNDNSSRFGKFIEIQFTSKGSLVGASIETYLLEKVRLITQAEGERNYHIFYELLQGMDDDDIEKYYLDDYSAEDFRMTNQSGTYDRRDGVEDYDTYQELKAAMDTMGFHPSEQHEIMTVTCAMLHASNLTCNALSADESEIDRGNAHLEPVLNLLGISADNLNQALCYFSIVAGREKHTRSLPKVKAEKGIEALIKATYGALFTFIVKRINDSISLSNTDKKKTRGPSMKKAATIGVLDIFGFESFKTNSFEQLCINYCNEALQQQFNLFVLKNEQEEYEREGIQWSFISFPENQDVLDLIDKKGSGILNILDDQCRAPGTTDKTFANDIYQKCTGHKRFEANFRQVGARKFGVHHYAGPVEYDTEGFVEKNRDELPKEATELLKGSKLDFVKKLASIISGEPTDPSADAGAAAAGGGGRRPRPGGGRSKSAGARVTVGGQFSKQLTELRTKIDLTSPHYVRCLKPNDQLIPDHFDPVIIADQLRCAGVVEAVRVSRVGYPQRYNHSMFVNRYRILGLMALKKASRSSRRVRPVDVLVKAIAEKIWEFENGVDKKASAPAKAKSKKPEPAKEVNLVEVGIQVGKTKVFLRRKAFDILETLRSRKNGEAAVKVQTTARRYVAQQEYKLARKSIISIQCAVRMMICAKEVRKVRRNHNATVIQTAYRKSVAHQYFDMTCRIARWLQRVHRGRMGRIRYEQLNRIRKEIVIAKYWRSYSAAKLYQKQRSAVWTLQCALRCHFARNVLKGLRAKQRDLQATANERDSLRNETQQLRNELEVARAKAKLESDRAAAADVALQEALKAKAEVEELTAQVAKLHRDLEESEEKVKDETKRANAATASAEESSMQVDLVKMENEELTQKLSNSMREAEEKALELTAKEEELENLNGEMMANTMKEVEDTAAEFREQIQELQKEKEGMAKELEEAKEAAQAATADLDELREENDQLRDDLEKAEEELVEGGGGGPRRDDDGHDGPIPTVHSEELDDALAEIEELKQKLEDAECRAAENADRAVPLAQGGARRTPVNEDAAEEILTLQDEVDRLNRELSEARRNGGGGGGGGGGGSFDPNSAEALIQRYDELRRLAEAGMEKDREIEALKKEVEALRHDLEAAEETPLEKDEEIEELQNTIDELRRALADGNGEDMVGYVNKPGILGRSVSVGTPDDATTQIISLKSINEMLRKEVEDTRREVGVLKTKLREEAERSAKELEAFAQTLRGVDELRKAAESMSREIQRNKKRNSSRKSQSGYDDASRRSGMSAWDDNTIATNQTDGTMHMEEATKILDSSSHHRGGGGGHGGEPAGALQLWAKVRESVSRPPQEKHLGRHGSMENQRDMRVQARLTPQHKQQSRRQRRRRGSGDNSVLSAFF